MKFLNPTAVVDGDSLNVADLFVDRYFIPSYQRDFSWGSKQISQLWHDLGEHYRRIAPQDAIVNAEGYFLGAIVTIKEQGQAELQLVDGQQRLTALSIIAIVLHEAITRFASQHPQAPALLHALKSCFVRYSGGAFESLLAYSDTNTNQAFHDLCINSTNRHGRRKHWLALPRTSQKQSAPHASIYSAFSSSYEKLYSFIRKCRPALRAQRLISFAQLFLECLVLLRIKATSYESAYAIFESLNDRGLKLSQADLVKNELLKVSMPADRDDVIQHWTDAKQNLSDTPVVVSELVHYSCLHRFGEAKAQVLFAFVKQKLASGVAAKDFAQGLEEDARALEQLVVQRSANWTKSTLSMLDDMTKVLAVKFAYPMLLAIHKRLQASPADFEKGVRLLMNFVFRFVKVGQGSPERLAVTAAKVGTHSRNVGLTNDQFLKEVSREFILESPDKTFSKEFEEYSEANTKQAYFTVYYIERHLLNGTIPLDHGKESNLEHIMPKDPKVGDWPFAHSLKGADASLYANYLWRIGNLLPLPESVNKSIKNKNIQHKMSGGTQNYGTCNLKSPSMLGQYLKQGAWVEESIEERQRALAALAPTVWSLHV
jgi:hypothetical protein